MDRIAQLQVMIERFPEDAFSRHALAMEWIKLGKELEAKQVMMELLEKFPEHTGTYYHLAKLLERMGENQEALVTYERGIEMAKLAQANHDRVELMGAYELLKDNMDL